MLVHVALQIGGLKGLTQERLQLESAGIESSNPSSPNESTDMFNEEGTASQSSGLTAGVVAGAVCVLLAFLTVGLFLHRRRRQVRRQTAFSPPPPPPIKAMASAAPAWDGGGCPVPQITAVAVANPINTTVTV
jgi:hypothetical protein